MSLDEISEQLAALSEAKPVLRFGQLVLNCIPMDRRMQKDPLWNIGEEELLHSIRSSLKNASEEAVSRTSLEGRTDVADPEVRRQLVEVISGLRNHYPGLKYGQLLTLLLWFAEGSDNSVYDIEDKTLLEAAKRHQETLDPISK